MILRVWVGQALRVKLAMDSVSTGNGDNGDGGDNGANVSGSRTAASRV